MEPLDAESVQLYVLVLLLRLDDEHRLSADVPADVLAHVWPTPEGSGGRETEGQVTSVATGRCLVDFGMIAAF